MHTTTWNDIPADLQRQVIDRRAAALGDLARWVYSNRPYDAAPDELQDTLYALMTFLARSASDNLRSLPALLGTIAYRQRCQRLRDVAKNRRAIALLRKVEPQELAAKDPLEIADSIAAALAAVDARSRDVVLRRHVLGQTYREIAAAVFGPHAGEREESHVSVILTRARRKMRSALDDRS